VSWTAKAWDEFAEIMSLVSLILLFGGGENSKPFELSGWFASKPASLNFLHRGYTRRRPAHRTWRVADALLASEVKSALNGDKKGKGRNIEGIRGSQANGLFCPAGDSRKAGTVLHRSASGNDPVASGRSGKLS